MKRNIYIIRHSSPFVEIDQSDKIPFEEQNRNMILSVSAEKKAEKVSGMSKFKNIRSVYSSNSPRAIATAKYFADINHSKIKVNNLLNERHFGIIYLEELPNDFVIKQFEDKNYKLKNGESLNEVKIRLKQFINNVLVQEKEENIVIILHGICFMCFLDLYCNVSYDGKNFKVIHDGKMIFNKMIKPLEMFKLELDDDKLLKISNIIY